MAYSVNWLTRVVTVPKSDLTLISASPEIYELSVVDFWREIHDIQDDEGMPYPTIMASNAPTTFGPRGVLIINNYRVEFEDGPYTVNLTEANSDIQANAVQNQVSISDKTVTGANPEAIAAAVWASAQDIDCGGCVEEITFSYAPEPDPIIVISETDASFSIDEGISVEIMEEALTVTLPPDPEVRTVC